MSSGNGSGLHQPIDAPRKSRSSFECLSLCVLLAQREFEFSAETAVPPKCANETRARRSPQMPHKFVSARKLSLLDWRKVPELAEEFAKQKSQKHETGQILCSWRGWEDSNLQPNDY
jgi:hypothetical protein